MPTIKTATTLQYRHGNGYDSIISVDDSGVVTTRTTVTPEVFAEFKAGGFDAADWDGESGEDSTGPDAYGELVATYDGTLHIEDEHRWAERVEFFGV